MLKQYTLCKNVDTRLTIIQLSYRLFDNGITVALVLQHVVIFLHCMYCVQCFSVCGLIDHRINYFIKENTGSETNNDKIRKITEEYRKLSLSQREKMVYNYIHQSIREEGLNDVCLEDLLNISNLLKDAKEGRKDNRRKE